MNHFLYTWLFLAKSHYVTVNTVMPVLSARLFLVIRIQHINSDIVNDSNTCLIINPFLAEQCNCIASSAIPIRCYLFVCDASVL